MECYTALRDPRGIRFFGAVEDAVEFAEKHSVNLSDRDVKTKPMKKIKPMVHILWEKEPLCGFTERPTQEWPQGQTWVGKIRWRNISRNPLPEDGGATCKLCIEEFEAEE